MTSKINVNTIEKQSGNNISIDNSLNHKSYTTTQRNALTSAAGDMIYNSTTSKVEHYNGSSWVSGTSVATLDYVIIAGGGGGGGSSSNYTTGGGGCAGGYFASYNNEASGGGDTSLESVSVLADGSTTYTVTVASKAGGGGNAFYIDGVQAPSITINEGSSAIFNLSDNTVDSHPFYLSNTSDGSHNSVSVYTTGVTFKINGSSVSQSAYASGYGSATTRALEITVAIGAPTLYYYCSSHSGMGNSISTP